MPGPIAQHRGNLLLATDFPMADNRWVETHREIREGGFVTRNYGLGLACWFGMATCLFAGEFRDLFDGHSLAGWVVEGRKTRLVDGKPEPIWRVENGCIVAIGGYGFLRYDRQQFSDFVLRVEYRFAPPQGRRHGNSGIGIRTPVYDPRQSLRTRPSYAAFEVQLLDDAGRKPSKGGTGSLYRYVAPTTNPAKPAPAWNEIEIECVGPRIRVRLNGEKILDVDQRTIESTTARLDGTRQPRGTPSPKDKPLRGYISLQSHTGRVEFRKVQIREMKRGATD